MTGPNATRRPLHRASLQQGLAGRIRAQRRGFGGLCKEELAKRVNSAVFPGQQGGPLEHVIAAKAVALRLAAGEEFAERQRRVLSGARVLAERLGRVDCRDAGIRVVTGGTDVHLVLVDLVRTGLTGQEGEDLLHSIGITVNRNAVPYDPRPPMVASGLRIGTPALATRGFTDDDFEEVADVIAEALTADDDETTRRALAGRVAALTKKHPLYPSLSPETE